MGQGVFFVMAAAVVSIAAAELLESSRPALVRPLKWMGGIVMVGAILYLALILFGV